MTGFLLFLLIVAAVAAGLEARHRRVLARRVRGLDHRPGVCFATVANSARATSADPAAGPSGQTADAVSGARRSHRLSPTRDGEGLNAHDGVRRDRDRRRPGRPRRGGDPWWRDGKRVALIEMERAGGTCLNHGCKPTKALRASAVVAHQARRAAEYGVAHRRGHASTSPPRSAGCAPSSARCSGRWTTGSTQRRRPGLHPRHGPLRTDPDGRQHEVTVSGQRAHRAGGLPQRRRPGLPAADRGPGLGRGHDRGRAAGPRRAARAPGRRRRRLHRLRVRPDVPPVRRRGDHPRRQRHRRPEDDDVQQILTDTFREEGITIRSGRPDPGRAARRRHRGRGGRRQHRDRQPPAAGHRPALQLRPARRPRRGRPTSAASS